MHCTRFACTSERPQLLNPHGAGGCPKTHVLTQTRTPRYTHTHVRACVCVCMLKQSWSAKRAAPECELMVASITPARPQTTAH